MFDIKKEYMRIFTQLADMKREGESPDLIAIYETVLNVISQDKRFHYKTHIELSQPREYDEHYTKGDTK